MADLNKVLRDAAGNRLNPETIISQVDGLPEKLAAIEAITAPEFATDTAYYIDDIVTYEDKLYKFTSDHAAGEWNPAHVSETTVVNELLEAGGLDLLADEYDSTATYDAGDYTIYERELYKCKTDNTTGAWDGTKWDKVTVANELQTANENIEDIDTRIDNILNNDIATRETSTIASKNYSIGDYIVLDDQLYKVTSAIASGATIVPGTNVSATTLETEIKTVSTTAVTNVVYDGSTRKLQKTINGVTTDVFTADNIVIEDSNNLATSDSVYEFGKQTIDDNIATEYDSSNTYNTGDYVTYNMKTYRCIEDSVTGAWDSSKWSQIFISDVLKNQYIVDTDDSNKLYFVTQSVVDGHIVEHYEEV